VCNMIYFPGAKLPWRKSQLKLVKSLPYSLVQNPVFYKTTNFFVKFSADMPVVLPHYLCVVVKVLLKVARTLSNAIMFHEIKFYVVKIFNDI
jgi:hypothetical protein